MVRVYIQEPVSWQGEIYQPGAVEAPVELAKALGIKLTDAETSELEGTSEVPTDDTEVVTPAEPPKSGLLFSPSDVLTDAALVDGQLNLDYEGITAEQIAELPSIGAAIAKDLLNARPVNGYNDFATFEQVARQIGVGNRIKFDQVRPLVTFKR